MIQLLKQPGRIASGDLEDWGPAKEPIGDLISRISGRTGSVEGQPDHGIWECSPGRWRRQIRDAEFAHFLSGRCTFIADDGQRLEIEAGDTTYWPANSMGVWEIHETVRKVYILLK
jgi:uncharacterized protein